MGWAPAAGIPLLWEAEDLTALKATHRSLPKEGERQPSLGGMLAIPAADRPRPGSVLVVAGPLGTGKQL